MNYESLIPIHVLINKPSWRRIKKDFLHHFHQPRADLLVWILVKKLCPTYYRKLDFIFQPISRYRELPSWRKAFKKQWRKDQYTPITLPLNEKYSPDAHRWVCTCPQFAKSRFLLCKHLVQAVKPVPPIFFLQVSRRRTSPFWVHPALIPLSFGPRLRPTTQPALSGEPLDLNQTPEDDDNESDSDDEDLDTEFRVNLQTYSERMRERVALIREFALGLEHQIQFGDGRMLDTLERDGCGFFRLASNCLDRERRFNSTRTAAPTTWEVSTSNAMFYRPRPSRSD